MILHPRAVPSGNGSAAAPTRRRLLAAAGTGAAATLLAACGERTRARSGHVVASEDPLVAFFDLDPVEPDPSRVLEIPGLRYRVSGARITPSLPWSEAEELGFLPADARDQEADGDQEVPAPPGEVYLLAELVVDAPAIFSPHLPEVDVHGDRLVIGGEPGEPWPRPMTSGSRVCIALTVPEDPDPEAAMIEVRCEDVAQRLSLVDGSRIASDLEHWYGQWYQASPAQVWWERRDEARGGALLMAGAVDSISVHPALGDSTWPSPGNILLGVELAVLPPPEGLTPLPDLALVLPDGAEARPRGATAAEALEEPEHPLRIWFEVPHEVEEATLRLALGVRDADGQETPLGTEEVPVTIRREPR